MKTLSKLTSVLLLLATLLYEARSQSELLQNLTVTTPNWDIDTDFVIEVNLTKEFSNINLTLETYSLTVSRLRGDDTVNIGYKTGTSETNYYADYSFETNPLGPHTFEFDSPRFRSNETIVQVIITCDNAVFSCEDDNDIRVELFGYSEEAPTQHEAELSDGGILLEGSKQEYIPFWSIFSTYEIPFTLPSSFPASSNLTDEPVAQYKLKVSRIWGDDKLEIGYQLPEEEIVYFAENLDIFPEKYSKFSGRIETEDGQLEVIVKCDNLVTNCYDSEFEIVVYGYTAAMAISTPSPTPQPEPDGNDTQSELIIQVASSLIATFVLASVVYFKDVLFSKCRSSTAKVENSIQTKV
mmetsp:Transcript_13858/g.15791  ORF Transcript_13858/g.15791 Transcript_13858/m.15791 type:complete len:353 (-) Transcript_13858:294-1352(-)